MLESMSLPERLRSMAAQVARNDLSGATTRRLIELDMLEAANLLDTRPASTPPGDAVAALNAALAQAFADDPANACRAHAAVLPILQQLSTPQPASDDPCVRHACKRVRMEMQARIDELSEVDDAKVERACAAIDAFNRRDMADKTPNDSWVSRPIIRAGLLAAIKGDSHAG